MTKRSKINDIQAEIGKSTSLVYNGLNVNLDYNNKLTGAFRVREYNKMRLGDSTVRACMQAMKLPILRANWDFIAASEDSLDQEVKDFVSQNLFYDMANTWTEWLTEALNYLAIGNAIYEKVYRFDEDGKIRLHKLAFRPSDSIWSWQMENGQPGITQITTSGRFSIPMEKMLVLVNEKEGENWEGISVLRSAYRNYYVKDALLKIDAIAAERQGLGIPEAVVPVGTLAKKKNEIEAVLQNLRTNEKAYSIRESNITIGFMDMKGHTVRDVMPSVMYHDRSMAKSILADFLELGSSSKGSYALSKDKTDFFTLSLEAIAEYIADAVNEHVVKPLVDYNFNGVGEYPKLTFSDIKSVDIAALSTALSTMATAKVITPGEDVEDWIRGQLKMPEKTDLMNPEVVNAGQEYIDELNAAMVELEGGQVDPNADPAQEDPQTASEEAIEAILGGRVGEPLSEETKRKISEALKKGQKKKKGQNPEIKKRQKQITELRKQIREFQTEAQKELLKMASKGEKVDKEKLAKFKLKLLDKKSAILDKIDGLKSEIDTLRAAEVLDDIGYEKFAEVLEGDMKDTFLASLEAVKLKLDNIIDGDDQRPTDSYKL